MSTASRWAGWARKRRGGPSPSTDRSPAAWLADGKVNLLVELHVTGIGWVDITSKVREAQGITIKRGQQEGQTKVPPSTMRFTLNNANGTFSNRNPYSPYFGRIGRNTSIRCSIGDDMRFVGQIAEFPQRWDTTGTDVWVPVEAAGSLRQYGQGFPVLRSPMYRAVVGSPGLLQYWPLDDGSEATQGLSAVDSFPLTVVENVVTFGSVTGPAGSTALADLSSGGRMSGAVAFSSALSYRIELVTKWKPIAATEFSTPLGWYTGGGVDLWKLTASPVADGGLYLQYVTPSGSVAGPFTSDVAVDDTAWKHIRIEGAYISPTSMSMNVMLNGTLVINQTVALAFGPVKSVTVNHDHNTNTAVPSMGHLAVWAPIPSQATSLTAMDGYSGETAVERIVRVAAEEHLPVAIAGDPAQSALVGPQRTVSALTVLQDAAGVDRGTLYEPRTSLGLRYRTLYDMYNQTGPTLDYASKHLSDQLEPNDDDSVLVNDMTVTRTSGSSRQYVKTSGPLNINDPDQDRHGAGRASSALTVPCENDNQLRHIAGWEVHRGTVDESRYPSVQVELHREVFRNDPTLSAQIVALDVTGHLTLTNLPAWLPPDPVELHIEGYQENIRTFTRTLTFNTSPGEGYHVAVYDQDRYASDGTTLSETSNGGGVDTTATVWNTLTPSGPVWPTTEEPYDWMVEGERVTVTEMTPDTNGFQSATVVRSVNGVVKSHDIGAEIELYRPGVYAL